MLRLVTLAKQPSSFSDSLPEVMATGEQVKHTLTLNKTWISLGLKILDTQLNKI